MGAALAAALLAGCGADAIRDNAQELINAGKYEKAVQVYQDGLRNDPENVTLRSGLLNAQESIFSRLMSSATSARAAGNDKEAEEILQRALAIDPNDTRAKAMALDVARDRRQKAALVGARDLLAKGMRERAMLTIEDALKDSPNNADLLALRRQLELEAKQSELGASKLAESRPVSLDFRDGNLRMILDAMTRNTGVNFVVDKDVKGDTRATIFMHQARLDDALEMLTATNQLAYKIVDTSTVMIYPKTPDKLKEYQDLLIRTFYLSNADVKQTAVLLKSMLKIRDPFIDEKLNMIMIRETPETIRLAERLIALHDIAEPEVMLELQVLEIQRNSMTELGINYPDTLTLTPIAPSGATNFTLGNISQINRDSIGINVPTVTLNLHRDVGEVNLLANPKIRVRNREKAKVLIGDKLPVVTTTGNAANNGFISESVQYVDVGLKLDVEPDIYLDDEVAVKVGLEVSSLVNQITTAGGSLVYEIGTRTANTVLRLRDGETQLLAGLINKEERMSANRVPGLGDLPLIGHLFASQTNNNQRTEIVLAVTPHIIRNIRRPDLNQTEFWSGTENDVRSRPLMLPAVAKAAAAAAGALPLPAAATAPGLPSQSPAVAVLPINTVDAAAPGAAAAETPPAALTLAAPAEVKVGDTFAVKVNMKALKPIRGMPVQLQFSRNTLQVLDAEEGDFFRQNGVATSNTKMLEQAQGRASMAVLRNIADGAKGEGTMMTVHFKAIAAGNAEVQLVSAKAVAAEPIVLPPLPAAAKIVVK
jgi:general secretion pathway protein D